MGGTPASKLAMVRRTQAVCGRCGFATSNASGVCQACTLLAGLIAGSPRLSLSSRGLRRAARAGACECDGASNCAACRRVA